MVATGLVREQWEETIRSKDLIRRLMDQGNAAPSQPFGVYRIEPQTGTPHWALPVARLAEADVFAFYGDTPEDLEREYGPYDPYSTFFILIDHANGLPAGMLRVIRRSPLGFKSLTDIESSEPGRYWNLPLTQALQAAAVDFGPKTTLDMVTMGVVPAYHRHAYSGRIAKAIYHMACKYTLEQAARYWVTIVDESAHNSFKRRLGEPFSYYEGIGWKPYLGSSLSLPVWVDIEDWMARLCVNDPKRFGWLFRGEGLQEVFKFPAFTGPTPA
ncbi:MAG TPA: hypothetical protein VLI05_02915 [Candidatus Saccharimonadia bacterium]|nr:hypothetical protein [Candidatus Saccharimonadia bacterium]